MRRPIAQATWAFLIATLFLAAFYSCPLPNGIAPAVAGLFCRVRYIESRDTLTAKCNREVTTSVNPGTSQQRIDQMVNKEVDKRTKENQKNSDECLAPAEKSIRKYLPYGQFVVGIVVMFPVGYMSYCILLLLRSHSSSLSNQHTQLLAPPAEHEPCTYDEDVQTQHIPAEHPGDDDDENSSSRTARTEFGSEPQCEPESRPREDDAPTREPPRRAPNENKHGIPVRKKKTQRRRDPSPTPPLPTPARYQQPENRPVNINKGGTNIVYQGTIGYRNDPVTAAILQRAYEESSGRLFAHL